MEEHELDRAVEDVHLIRNVMDRSYESAAGLDNVFIWWGIVLIVIGGLCNILFSFLPGFSSFIVNAPYII